MTRSALEDTFVSIEIEHPDGTGTPSSDHNDPLYHSLVLHSSAKAVNTELVLIEAFRSLYPNHALVVANDYTNSILTFPNASASRIPEAERILRLTFIPGSRRDADPGVIVETPVFDVYEIEWEKMSFKMYTCLGDFFILHDGPERHIRSLMIAAGAYAAELHKEIWVFEGAYWTKNHELWNEIQKARWEDLILKEEFKAALRNDIDGFFSQEDVYHEYSIPWKRGILLHGPPGDGKSTALKAIMKSCPGPSLYVRSIYGEGGMALMFQKARQEAPCLLVLEDIDSIINDGKRSFFLNQLDGLEGNDGILLVCTTNYLERLDPSISKRPSRIDRKFLFSDPDLEERELYAEYWRRKLEGKKHIDYKKSFCRTIADLTDGFSFAYLKEVFVSSLVLMATGAETHGFERAVKNTIKLLRQQIEDNAIPITRPSVFKQFISA